MLRTMQMKREGQKSGVSDILFAHPVGPYHGLFIELKDYGKYLKPDQKEFIQDMREAGYMAFGVRGWVRAARLLKLYCAGVKFSASVNLYFGGAGHDNK